MPKIRFTKMHGGGNDFIVIDAVTQKISMPRLLDASMRLANRRWGVGCDQILILRKPKKQEADFEYQIINADGSEVGQCGNGARCAHVFLQQKGLTDKDKLLLHTDSTTIVIENTPGGKVRAHLAVPRFAPKQIPLVVTKNGVGKSRSYKCPKMYSFDMIVDRISPALNEGEKNNLSMFAVVSLGNPHAVFLWSGKHLLEDDEAGELLHKLGRSLNRRKEFFPEGVNVGLFHEQRDRIIDLRVYERGVGETPSCGSGAAAAAVVWQYYMEDKKPVQVHMQGGVLTCHWPWKENPSVAVWLEGEINFVFDGEIDL